MGSEDESILPHVNSHEFEILRAEYGLIIGIYPICTVMTHVYYNVERRSPCNPFHLETPLSILSIRGSLKLRFIHRACISINPHIHDIRVESTGKFTMPCYWSLLNVT